MLSHIVSVKFFNVGHKINTYNFLYVLIGMLYAADTPLRHQLQNIQKNGITDKVPNMIVNISNNKLACLTWLPQTIILA